MAGFLAVSAAARVLAIRPNVCEMKVAPSVS